jgi:tripartite-type tricarboxylate transporter receptor subunit TctC
VTAHRTHVWRALSLRGIIKVRIGRDASAGLALTANKAGATADRAAARRKWEMLMNLPTICKLSLALLAMTTGADFANAQGASPYYKGKTLTIVVGSSTGGGYDTYARLLGHYLGKHIPGEPNVIVSNMPGAGSDLAAAYVARVAPKDGTFVAATYGTQPLDSILADATDLNYDPSRVNYLGTAISDNYLCIVRPDAPATTFDDMFNTQVIMGGTAANGEVGYLPIMLNNVLGTKFKVVFGYPGSREIIMAIQKGEVQGVCGIGWLSLKSQYPDMLKNGGIKIFVQENEKGLPELDKMGIPLTVSYAHNEQQRRILEIIYSQEVFSRPYFVAAEVPADRLQTLRRAFMETWRDPDLLTDAAKMNFDIGPTSGEEIQSLLQKIYASPPALLQSAKEAIKLK